MFSIQTSVNRIQYLNGRYWSRTFRRTVTTKLLSFELKMEDELRMARSTNVYIFEIYLFIQFFDLERYSINNSIFTELFSNLTHPPPNDTKTNPLQVAQFWSCAHTPHLSPRATKCIVIAMRYYVKNGEYLIVSTWSGFQSRAYYAHTPHSCFQYDSLPLRSIV